eukprot:Phypoly_transcript_03451.p1 GENE.Phypoly_transcript_03451~~Phypoly_transcript_03451.p1  ORF type:complete len:619 (+),score=90.34 Phypoly_transcript_03451:557-2413(+)
MPFVYPYVGMTDAAHQYITVPQLYAQKREVTYPRGNMIGGSSGANALIYFRGSVRDFTIWRDDFGLEGWGFDDVLPYFKKFENNEDVPNSPDVHGYSGPINITITRNHYLRASGPIVAWSEAAERMGYPKIQDSSDPRTVYGASDSWQSFVGSSGRRSDSSVYIDILDKQGKVCWNKAKSDCLEGQKLHVWNGTHVTRVLIDDNKRAYGVEYAQGIGLDRNEHPLFPPSTSEATKNNQPYSKWDRSSQTILGIKDTKAERLGAPVAKSLGFDYSRPHDQYIPGIPTITSPPLTATAKYEVILAAGSIITPQLLMLSGIGPKEHLAELEIPLVQDLPVGAHTNDHQEVFLQWRFPDTYKPPFNLFEDILKGPFGDLHKYVNRQRSYYSQAQTIGGLDGSSDGPSGDRIPKWHMHHIEIGGFENNDFNIGVYDDTFLPPYRVPRSLLEIPFYKGLSSHVHGCELSSNNAHGRIFLRNKDPFAPPFVDPRWGASSEDIAELVNCVKTLRWVMGNTTDKTFVGVESEPSASAQTDTEIAQFIRNSLWGHHISSSAPMGNCTSPYAVTDYKGRVYGVDALRVVDISIFPTIPHGNPAGVVMMAAEKLAEQIMKDYNVTIPKTL